ncbi:MAG: NADH-quinone oxidoreductase subunit NuoH [Planctomycetales bacterium]|nr:NADH-quinone oxidoreductase subunit NuoH [Planctomycetales bacterium]
MTDISIALIKIGVLLGGIMTAAAYFVLLERRVAAWVQDRRGPNRVGVPLSLLSPKLKDLRLFGLGQPAADGLKMILKEEYTPAHVDRKLYALAPIVIMSAALSVYAVIPFGSEIPAIPQIGIEQPVALTIAPLVDVGMIFVFALSSIAVYGVILGGWASNNKYSFLGGLRSSAQMVSYELPLGLGLLGVVLASGSLRLDTIIGAQAESAWYAFMQPLGFIVFVVAAFAEAGRLPFDLPECEQELIGGYHTEYSGMKLVLFLTAEFIHMITASFLIVILFLGGWHFPFLTGGIDTEITWPLAIIRVAVLMAKVFGVIFFFMLVRWSWPRFRFDQLMTLAWKIMLPLGVINLIAVACVTEILHGQAGSSSIFIAIGIGWFVAVASWVVVAMMAPMVTDNRPQHCTDKFAIDSQMPPME